MRENIDLSILPEEAKKEILDFYEFLIQKYVRKVDFSENTEILIEQLIPQPIRTFDTLKREEIYER